MTSTTETSGPDGAITVLRGHLVDQAALHGLLARLRDIGLPLISVARVVPEHAEERDCAGGSPPSAGPAPSDPSRRPHPLPTDT
ncbi:MAG: hypothetical protein ABI776_14240 [Nocardioidaceae bacterium]